MSCKCSNFMIYSKLLNITSIIRQMKGGVFGRFGPRFSLLIISNFTNKTGLKVPNLVRAHF
jgi:hypothetical protein